MSTSLKIGWLGLFFFLSGGWLFSQSDSIQNCQQYLDRAQQLYGESKYYEAEQTAFSGWELAQKLGIEELMARSCYWLGELNRRLGKDNEAFDYSVRGKYLSNQINGEYTVPCQLTLLKVLAKMEMWSMVMDEMSGFKFPKGVRWAEKAEIQFIRFTAMKESEKYSLALKLMDEFFKEQNEWNQYPELEQRYLILYVECALLADQWKKAEATCNVLFEKYYQQVSKIERIHWNSLKGQVHIKKKEFNVAIETYNKSLFLCETSDVSIRLELLLSIAEAYFFMENWTSAQQYIEQALDISEQLGDIYHQALCNVFLSAVYNKKGWISYSIETAQAALAFAEKCNDLEIHYEMHNLLSRYHTVNGNSDLAQYHKEEANRVMKLILGKRELEYSEGKSRQNRLKSKAHSIQSDLDGEQERKRAVELRIEKTEKEKELAELENKKRVEDIEQDLKVSEIAREKLRVSAELDKQKQLNIIQDLQIAETKEREAKLILENEALRQREVLSASEKERVELSLLDQENKRQIEEQRYRQIYYLVGFLLMLVSLLVVLYFLNSLKKKNQIINSQNAEIQKVNEQLNEKNFEILSGIEYASKFQSILFPTEKNLQEHIKGAFVLHRPLEVVSGDLPFLLRNGDHLYVAAVDCIGHGVAASMLSIMSYFNLNEIIRSDIMKDCSKILHDLHRRLELRTTELRNVENNFLISIDVALIRINLITNEMQFAGANLPLVLQTTAGTELVKGDAFSIGEKSPGRDWVYTDYNRMLNKGDRMFVFSDGFFHQFGGKEGKQKLSKKRTTEWIAMNTHLSIEQMKWKMNELFEEWKGETHQTDDVVFIGLEL